MIALTRGESPLLLFGTADALVLLAVFAPFDEVFEEVFFLPDAVFLVLSAVFLLAANKITPFKIYAIGAPVKKFTPVFISMIEITINATPTIAV